MEDNQTRQNGPLGPLVAYNLPVIGYGFMYMLFSMYYMKFSTDVLYVAPAFIGTVFGLARIWDAVTDPLAGYLSDRTNHHMGRRRPWLLFSAVPVGLTFIMAFSPPTSLEGTELALWIIFTVFAFYTASTAFVVPHMSLGAELSYYNYERNRLFGFRYGSLAIGYTLGLGAISLLLRAEAEGTGAARSLALLLSILSAAVMAAFLILAAIVVKERAGFQGRSGRNPFSAFADVLKNKHARIVLFVTFVEYTGLSITGVMSLYVTEYVLKAPEYGPVVLLVWLLLSIAGVPVWIRLAKRFAKKKLWITSLLISGFSYGSLIFMGEGDIADLFVVMTIAGFAAACGATVGPATQSDVIDYDELHTGERKEGVYFASWNLVVKAGGGIASLLAGAVLQWSGFIPKVEQTMLVKTSMLAYLALFPFAMYMLAALVLLTFSFGEKAHGEVRSILARRNKERTDG